MKRFEEQIKKQSQSIHLRGGEQRDLRERVVSYMEYHPIPGSSWSNQMAPVSTGAWSAVLRYVPVKLFAGVTAALIVVAVPVLAERAVPGDMLYSVKVGFNEEVRSTIARSPYQEIEWETERLNRRLAEAQLLAREGRLTEEHEERVAQAVRNHSDAARDSIERLRANNADDAALAEITLAALFDVHSAVLHAFNATTSTSTQRQNRIAEAIANSRDDAERREAAGERPSYQGLLARIETETNRAYQLFAQTAASASEDDLESMSRRLDDVDRKVQQGIVAHEAGDDMAARTLLSEALTSTRKVISFMDNLEVRRSVALDLLVPVEYTVEELIAALQAEIDAVTIQYEYLHSIALAGDDTEAVTIEKLDGIPAVIASSTAAVTAGDVVAARDYVQIAQTNIQEIADHLAVTDLSDVATDVDTATSTGTSTPGRQGPATDGNDVVEHETATSSDTSPALPAPANDRAATSGARSESE